MIKKVLLMMGLIGVIFMQQYSYAGDAFLKGGIMLKPDGDIDFKHKWRISFGSDYMNWDQLGVGFEVQMAYSSEDISDETYHYIPLNIFINVKYKTATEGVRPFGGGGVGLLSTLAFDGGSNWFKRAGIHAVGGVEFGSLEESAFVIELQLIKPISGDEPKDTEVHFYAGIKW
jgi:hypothetical protein